ncbi:MAG: ribonuclease R [Clostridiales bacterium]|nr:ribonuclease R [Clostridiales bacterium]
MKYDKKHSKKHFAAHYGGGGRSAYFDVVPKTVSGVIDCKGDRFGFIRGENTGDVFISGVNLCGARHGDAVRAIITSDRPAREGGRRREGRVIEINEKNSDNIVATVVYRDNVFCAVPDDKHFGELLEIQGLGGASEHDKVIIELVQTHFGDRARVVAVLGRFDEIGMDVKSVIAAHNLRTEFPRDVIEQADAFSDVIDSEEASKPYRRDYRGRIIFTIDGSGSKDFDDAVSIEKTDSGYLLGVYIADVSEYVTERSPLDREALHRGTSVYLADRVIPMLPEKLSNGLCSLNEGEDRLVLAAEIELDVDGNRIGASLHEGVIKSCARLTYTGVQAILDGDKALRDKFERVVPSLELMQELAKKRIKIREQRGSIEFDLTETEIKFDEVGHVADIARKPRLMSAQIIEEFMILANCAVAEKFGKTLVSGKPVPFVYRVHERPSPEKISALNDYLDAVGAGVSCPLCPVPSQVAKILERVRPDISAAVSKVTLRAMSKADYQPTNKGHFGLAEPYYCHFTSPIRRYPDLAIHRIIKAYLRGGVAATTKYRDFTVGAAMKSSKAERTAQDCERKVDDYKKAEYMSRHIGERYAGIISSVTDFGFFVELENSAEGLVRMNSLPPAAIFDAKRLCISCGRASFKLGDKVNIIVEKVEGDRIDFLLA